LAIRRIGAFNISMLGKWCWRLLTEKGGLWYRVLKARYGEVGGRIREGGRDSSVWWKMLCRICEGVGEGVRNWFDDNIRRVIGHGRGTLFWYDKWIGDMPLRLKFPRLFDLAVEKDCTVGGMEGRGRGIDGAAWKWRRRLFAWEESMREYSLLLHNIVLQDTVLDSWRWLLDPIHGYTVRGAYRFITTRATWWTGLLLMMFGTSMSFRRCLCWCGASFITVYQLKTIWWCAVFSLQRTCRVRLVATPLNR